MSVQVNHQRNGDAALWIYALAISIFLNLIIISCIAYHSIKQETARKKNAATKPLENVLLLSADFLKKEIESPASIQKLARTSEEQRSEEAPADKAFIGERNTKATSDAAPIANQANLPSQQGRAPRENELPETTNSQYREGRLKAETLTTRQIAPSISPEKSSETSAPQRSMPESDLPENPTPTREKLYTGLNAIEQKKAKAAIAEKAQSPEAREGLPDKESQRSPVPKKLPKKPLRALRKPIDDPAFRGNQAKTKILGSLSRNGVSALDVTNSPLGRYQAKIARAIEREWQRNCMKHRDFIVPGYIVVRFVVDKKGRVKTVNFIGDIEGGAVQKGFTLSAIREAPIPAMSTAVLRDSGGESLELTFSFYF